MGEDEQANNIVLIDYGYASKYNDPDGNHFENEELDTFRGNLFFASLNQLNFESPCRKNDLLSLCYFMLYMLNGLKMPLYSDFTPKNLVNQFESQLNFKQDTTF